MGLQLSLDLVAAGAKVLMMDIKPPPKQITNLNDTLYLSVDITDEQAVLHATERAISTFGGVDLLANVAGALWFGRDQSALDINLGVWDQVLNINLKSCVHLSRAVVPSMQARGGGAMVHFSTIQCMRGDAAPQDAYQAAKAGVIALSKSLAIQLGDNQIRSNVIVPGPCESPMQARWDSDPASKNAVASIVPLGRVGQVTDMSAAALFLLSNQASFITGTELVVDGGLLALP